MNKLNNNKVETDHIVNNGRITLYMKNELKDELIKESQGHNIRLSEYIKLILVQRHIKQSGQDEF